MKKINILTNLLAFTLIIQCFPSGALAAQNSSNVLNDNVKLNIDTKLNNSNIQKSGFELIKKEYLSDKKATAYYLKHKKSGACVFYMDDDKDEKTFSIGFKTPPSDNKGANHVLEHSLMCSNKKYPSKDLGTYLQGNSVATMINAFTLEDSTSYAFKTSNKADFYNLADVYINAVLNPSVLNDENIFKQQGIRKEYSKGKVDYNGIVYNEMRLRSFQTKDNALDFVYSKAFANLFGNTVPAFDSGGNIGDIINLKYSDVLNVYKKYYTPSNSIICISGNQDILKTLNLFNSYLKNYNYKPVNVTWNYSPTKPKSSVQTYNVTSKTKSVDIGFLYEGPKITKIRESYAYEVILSVIHKRLNKTYNEIYSVGGNPGGISDIEYIISGVALNQKDKALRDLNSVLESLKKDGIGKEELNQAIAEVEDGKENSTKVTNTSDLALNGFVYTDNPFSFLSQAEDFKYLRNNPSYFKDILNKYFINNPYKSIVVSGPVAKPGMDSEIKVQPSEFAKIKEETQKFNAWVDTPDSEETLAKLPVLSLGDFKEDKLSLKIGKSEKLEDLNGIPCYATLDDSTKAAYSDMYFELPQFKDDLEYAALMAKYLNYEFSSKGFSNVQCALLPCEKFSDENNINPRIIISTMYDKKPVAEATKETISLLNDDKLFSPEELAKFLKKDSENRLQLSSNPYQIAYDLMMSSESQSGKFNTFTLGNGNNGDGSLFYFNFIKQMLQKPNYSTECAAKLKNIFKDTINKNGLIIDYCGSNAGYNTFKSTINPIIKAMIKKTRPVYNNTIKEGYSSAIVLSDKQDVSQTMQIGSIYKSGYKYSGKMNVLANLLTSKYLTPVLRDKMGAYGAGVNFTNGTAIFSTAGAKDIDDAVKVFKGSGDYLRKLSITQKQLNSIIISTLSVFDEQYNADNYYFGGEEVNGCSMNDLKKIRQDILSTTVNDIKNYAGFLDKITSENNVFAIANKDTADKTKFPFAYTVNSSDFTVKQNPKK